MKFFRSIFVAVGLALALPACSTITSLPSSPSAASDETVLDEKLAITVEQAYRFARTAVELAVDQGLVEGELAGDLQVANQRAFEAVQAVRSAYEVGNADGYVEAYQEARLLIADLMAFGNKEPPT